MSMVVEAPAKVAPARGKRTRSLLWAALAVVAVALIGWGGVILYQRSAASKQSDVPTVRVARGDVSLSIFARGEVRGGNSQVMTAPMTGGSELHIRYLTRNGAPVKAGEMVVQFDTTDQEFALREAQSDLAESEEHIRQASAQLDADTEEDRYALAKAKTDLELAQLEARKNPILAPITAKQNDLALSVAHDKLSQLEQNGNNRKATDLAGIQIQQAAKAKAEAKLLTAKQNIGAMTLAATSAGYVAVKTNTNTNFLMSGMELPIYQLGDAARPGMAIAEIPDLNHWEVAANITELDRGHLVPGDKVKLTVVAMAHTTLHGHVTDIGSTSGSPWDRHFECKIALDDQAPDLRPGMSANVEITTETMKNALWLPAQALFESDGKMFVYLRSGNTFTRRDVTLVRRNETRVVLTGVQQGQEVALANPTDGPADSSKKGKQGKSALEALPK